MSRLYSSQLFRGKDPEKTNGEWGSGYGKRQPDKCRSPEGPGEECMKSFPWGKRSEGRGRVGMRSREEQGRWKWRQPRRFVRAPSGNSLLGT